MRTGKLSISRGAGSAGSAGIGPRLSIVARESTAAAAAPAAPASPEYRPIHDRLSALERLARLHEQSALTDEEFAAEKAAILGPGPVLNEPLLTPE